MPTDLVSLFVLVLSLVGPPPGDTPAALQLKPGDTMVAVGDSITAQGGYLQDAYAVITAKYPELQFPAIIGAGQVGATSWGMAATFQGDVVARHPAYVTISAGINDCSTHTPVAFYKNNVGAMVDAAQAAGIKVILLTPTVLGEDPNGLGNQSLLSYVAAEKGIAAEKHCQLADLHQLFLNALTNKEPSLALTADGVHMAPAGNAIMALGLLRAFGVADDDLKATPAVSNGRGASGVTRNAATLNGQLTSTGTAATVVSVFWGKTDGGTNPAAWDYPQNLGTQAVGNLSVNVTDLSPDTTYCYRFCASNNNGACWAKTTSSLITGDVWVDASQAFASPYVPTPGVFTFHRPIAGANAALTVPYTTGGTALPGADFVLPSSNVTFAAAADSASVMVVPAGIVWGTSDKTLTLTLESNLNCIAAASPSNSAAITITCNGLPKTGPFKMKIAFGAYNRPETLTNFPALVVISNGMGGTDFDFRRYPFLNPSGRDLRFWDASETTELPYEIDQWTNAASAAGLVWVRVPTIAGDGSSCIWAKWGDAALTNQPAYTTNGAVWANGFVGVWHMNRTNVLDSTANRNDATSYGSNVSMAGVVGVAQNLAGGKYLDCGNKSCWTGLQAVSVEYWIKTSECNARPICKENTIETWVIGGGNGAILLRLNGSGSAQAISTGKFNDNVWHMYGATWANRNDGQERVYMDGAQTDLSGGLSGALNSDSTFKIGDPNNAFPANPAFPGGMDEVRIASVRHSSNWIWASFMTMASNVTFSAYSAPSAVTPAGTTHGIPFSWLAAHGIANTNDSVEADDPDGDGASNLNEYYAGTDPTNPASVLAMQGVLSINNAVVRWSSVSNKSYALWSTLDLVTGFSLVQSNIPATPAINTYTDAFVTPSAQKFYRIEVQRP